MAQNNEWVSKPALAKELAISTRALSRWMADRKLNFPKPAIVNGRNFFSRGEVENWKLERARASVRIAPIVHLRKPDSAAA
jgi:hypothetical protein